MVVKVHAFYNQLKEQDLFFPKYFWIYPKSQSLELKKFHVISNYFQCINWLYR